MIIALLADDISKAAIQLRKFPADVELIWADSLRSLGIIEADAYFDLEFEFDAERIVRLKKLLHKPIFINSVADTCAAINAPFIRLNAWPTMLSRDNLEIAGPQQNLLTVAGEILNKLNWPYVVVPDITGMVTPRIVVSIINEAWYTLGEKVSTKEEIDTAMKLGTNYPYGPFEWMERIGERRVIELLKRLQQSDPAYDIAPALINLMEE